MHLIPASEALTTTQLAIETMKKKKKKKEWGGVPRDVNLITNDESFGRPSDVEKLMKEREGIQPTDSNWERLLKLNNRLHRRLELSDEFFKYFIESLTKLQGDIESQGKELEKYWILSVLGQSRQGKIGVGANAVQVLTRILVLSTLLRY